MFEKILQLLETNGFIPHGHCYLWQTNLVALHVLADGLIALAYFSIPIMLIYFVRKRDDGDMDSLGSYLLGIGITQSDYCCYLFVYCIWDGFSNS